MTSNNLDTLSVLGNLFPGVDAALLVTLADCARVNEYTDGAIICRQGAWENELHIIMQGQANVWIYHVGEPVLVAYISAGEPIGEIELLMDSPRTAQVLAAGDVSVLELSYSDIDLAGHPALFRALARTVIERLLRAQQERVHDVAERLRRREQVDELFVSYSRNDELFVKQLVTDLKHHRVSVWLDQFDIEPGEGWARQIGEALDRCQMMLLIMTPDAMESGNSEDEWNYYLDQTPPKPIIPVLKESCRIPYRLNKLQYVDFVDHPYDQALARLVATVNAHYADESARGLLDGTGTKDP